MSSTPNYGNDSISQLKGADRVRKRPGVIFGSDGLDGCQHAVFEILSNSIDEAREGYGKTITLTYYKDRSITGSWFSVSFMPAVSITMPMAATMSFLWV